jgi:hypothetical protein
MSRARYGWLIVPLTLFAVTTPSPSWGGSIMSPESADGPSLGVLSAGAFPLEFPEQWESKGISEVFPWGPQMLFLLCVFGWFICGDLGDLIPQGAAMPLALSLGVLAACAVIRILRRRTLRVVLVPMAGEVGVYREKRFAYRFSASALRKDSWDWIYPVKMLILIGILVLITGGLLVVALRDLPKSMNDFWVFAFLFGYACFAFAAIVRSQFLIVWYWIPDGTDGGTRRVGLPRRRERALSSAR